MHAALPPSAQLGLKAGPSSSALVSAKPASRRHSAVFRHATSTLTMESPTLESTSGRSSALLASTSPPLPAQSPAASLTAPSPASRAFSQHKGMGSGLSASSSNPHLRDVTGLTSAIIARASNKTLEELSAPGGAKQRVAYQGVPGAYSEVAAFKACPDLDPLPCEQFEVAFQALTQWMVDRAVLPIENSLGGSIHTVIDLLLRYRLHIVGETSIVIRHCLVALPGTKKSDITRVMSHPQALAQVDNYLRGMGVIKEAVDDTAGAAQMVARQQLKGVAAVCSRRAAELYGLDVVEEGIQDDKDNITRFIVLSRNPLVASESDSRMFKTSIVFSLPRGPGQLFRALAVFALRDIDLTKIESRPLRSNPMMTLPAGDATMSIDGLDSFTASPQNRFNYMFYVDFVGSLADVRVQNALRHLQETAPFLRVLGAYPMDMDIGSTSNEEHTLAPIFFNGGSGSSSSGGALSNDDLPAKR